MVLGVILVTFDDPEAIFSDLIFPKHVSSIYGSDFHVNEYSFRQSTLHSAPQGSPSQARTSVKKKIKIEDIYERPLLRTNIVHNDYLPMNNVRDTS